VLLSACRECREDAVRLALTGALKNLCFDQDHHPWLLDQLQLVPTLLYMIAGPEELSFQDKVELDPVVWQPPDSGGQKKKHRDRCPEVWVKVLEAVLLLSAHKPTRIRLRDCGVYAIVKQLDEAEGWVGEEEGDEKDHASASSSPASASASAAAGAGGAAADSGAGGVEGGGGEGSKGEDGSSGIAQKVSDLAYQIVNFLMRDDDPGAAESPPPPPAPPDPDQTRAASDDGSPAQQAGGGAGAQPPPAPPDQGVINEDGSALDNID